MPGDPVECRQHAMRCVELAEQASNAHGRQVFLDLSEHWLKLAKELKSAQVFLAAMNGEAFDRPKVGLLSFPNEGGSLPIE